MTIPFLDHYGAVLAAGLVFAALTALAGLFTTTPYGRFASRRFGPDLPVKLGWFIMESPALPVFWATFLLGTNRSWAAWVFAALWTAHYANRSLAFPALMRATPDSRMSWTVPATGVPVVVVHAWLYGAWVGQLGALDAAWLRDPRFALGLLVWGVGFALILHTEHTLRQLRDARQAGGPRYRIPHGGGYRWVSSPHYLGEILAFTGMATVVWCPGGLFVLTTTLANLVPRALATHRWYRKTFADYPPERRALVPFVL